MARFEAVIFDCDGVLVDSEALALEVELEILEGCGLTFEKADFIRRFMGAADTHFRDLLDVESRARLGRPLRPDFLDLAHAARERICRERLTEVLGARAAVEATGLVKAVASSSRMAFLREKLTLANLIDVFEPHIYSTEMVANAKPAPDIFLHAAARLGVAPGRALVLEDSVNGVRAGAAAGMTVWAFVGGGHCDSALAEHLIEAGAERAVARWDEVPGLLARAAA
jgi:beta-phosphoglucomutase-like phosphatase (HAD superfamily)